MNHDELADLLGRALHGGAGAEQRDGEDHLDEATLAELLDGELGPTERESAEDHLARCPQCRELALEAAAAIAATAGIEKEPDDAPVLQPDPTRWRGRWQAPAALAAALVLTAVTAVLFTRLAALPNLDHIGVTVAELDAAPLPVRQAVRRALTGRLRPIDGLPEPRDLGTGAVVRGSTEAGPPVPLTPRWSAVEHARPRLIWRAHPSAVSWEILVIDERENLVTAFELEGTAGIEVLEARLPETAELQPGAVYLWKVNERFEDRVESSPWVPFRALAARERDALALGLDSAGDDPFLRAAVLAGSGIDGAALDELARVPASATGDDPRRTLARALLERHRLSAGEVHRELARRLGET